MHELLRMFSFFQPHTPFSLADSYLTEDIADPLPRLLNVDLRPIYKLVSSILQQLEQKTWKSSQFCKNPKISALLQHHFDGIISSIQIEYGRAEKERTKLVKEVASFVNQTITLQRQRRSPLLFAMGAATAIILEPLLEKAGCRLLSFFGLCESSKRKMEQLEGRLHYLESRMVHLHNEERESIQVMASSSLKLHEDTRKVLNYSEDNFEILQTNLEVLQKKTMEEIEQAHAFCAQSAINNVSWTLNAMHSELQVQTLYLTEQRNIFFYKHWSAIQGNTASRTSTLRRFTENNYNSEAGRLKVFYTIRPLKFTLQPALSEKCFFQSTRTVNHNGGASIQW